MNFEIGDKVTFIPYTGAKREKYLKGIVKSTPESNPKIRNGTVEVIYNIPWKTRLSNYKEYIGESTDVKVLK